MFIWEVTVLVKLDSCTSEEAICKATAGKKTTHWIQWKAFWDCLEALTARVGVHQYFYFLTWLLDCQPGHQAAEENAGDVAMGRTATASCPGTLRTSTWWLLPSAHGAAASELETGCSWSPAPQLPVIPHDHWNRCYNRLGNTGTPWHTIVVQPWVLSKRFLLFCSASMFSLPPLHLLSRSVLV